MKKTLLKVVAVLGLSCGFVTGCKKSDTTITVCASQTPHAEVLENAMAPVLKQKGYTLKVTVLDWSLQNDAVYNGDYDANYFQHRPYLQSYDSGTANYSDSYTYTKVFPTAAVHFEPLRIYAGKSTAADFQSKKALSTTTYEICNDPSNALRALDLLVANGVIASYEKDEKGNPSNVPANIHLIAEEQLVASKPDYDYALLPCNTALTGHLTADTTLPVESDTVADAKANVIAANVSKYQKDSAYKKKIDALSDAALSSAVASYLLETYKGVIETYQKDLRA
ncbi:MAG: MetQ/NlpA family ABC transporter substrate-binding protein [Bacilli bacterium]|jgi:D-methionine transport system substrate-binding protein|nr:MetQ/NlpA family ABC transporter substrate-binding protein [Bacilli bacterium]